MKKTIIFGFVALSIILLFFLTTDKIYSVSCVDFDDPATWEGKIILSEYGYYIVKDDVVLCNKTYDFSSGKSIMIGYPHHSAVDIFDCNGATIIGRGKIEGTGPLISVTCNLSAPYLPCYANLTVKNCKLQNADSGIAVNHANYTTLENNEVTNTNYGTMIWGAEDCKVKNNVSSGNTYYGFSIEDDIGSRNTKRCNIEDNIAENNGRYGINLNSTDDSIVIKNTVRNNIEKGIYVYDSNNNLIYNNIFENLTNGYCHANSLNSWHIAPTLGLNIINGPSIGGNFWSDYSGADNDYDGFGDTQYSIPGGCDQFDNFPLVPIYLPPDTDGDGIDDTVDNCILIANPDQKDFDTDGIGDVCDIDSDNDGIDNNYDFCPETKLTENFIKLLPKHFGLINGDSVFETREKLLGDIIESKYTLTDTSGCNCQQILQLKPGLNIGEKQFGCTEATIKNVDRISR